MAKDDDEARRDVSPPGWEKTTENMKGKPGIDNPFALAWWMQEQGFTPHDAADSATLDAACEMYAGSAHDDGLPGVTAGAKEGNGGPADTYVSQTEELTEIPEHEDEEHAPLAGPGAESGESMRAHDDDDEKLLDDSESEVGGIFPTGATPAVGGSTIGQHSTISDPAPEVSGGGAIEVEGEETNDDSDEEEEEEEDKHDDDDDKHDDDDVEMAY